MEYRVWAKHTGSNDRLDLRIKVVRQASDAVRRSEA